MTRFVAEKWYDHRDVKRLLYLSKRENKYTNDGPVKRALEEEISLKLGLSSEKRVVCLGNGTAALHALLYLYEQRLGRSLKWMTPSFTFPTPVVGGFDAVIERVDETGSLSPDVTLDSVDGVIITTLFGATNAISYWSERCKREGKILILDNASSPCSRLNGESISSLGDASFSSLHHTKFLGVGEGGFVVVQRDMADAVNQIACFGFDAERNFKRLSSNFKMSDISAAFTLSHVRGYRIDVHEEIQKELTDFVVSNGADVLGRADGVVHGNFPVLFCRKTEKSQFAETGVEVNKYYRPLSSDPEAWKIYDRIINFPLHDRLTAQDLSKIKSAIRGSIESEE
jgi:dTDP-4-amino-4,6-dideoxygalactose transaminase